MNVKSVLPASALIGLLLASVCAASAQTTDPLFLKTCAPCHGPDGRAKTPAGRKIGAHDLTLSKATTEEITRSIREGRLDKAGKPVMPAFGKQLSDAEVESLIKTVLSFRK